MFWVLLNCKNDCKNADHMLECSINWFKSRSWCNQIKKFNEVLQSMKISSRNNDSATDSLISMNDWIAYFEAFFSARSSWNLSELDCRRYQSSFSDQCHKDTSKNDQSLTCDNVWRLVSQLVSQLILQLILQFKY
jgi:hypothetical protein